MASAAATTGVTATAAAAAATAMASAAAAAAACQYKISAEFRFVLVVEHIERRQADVGDFLLAENHPRPGILGGYIGCRHGC
jgi:hypothetical protein